MIILRNKTYSRKEEKKNPKPLDEKDKKYLKTLDKNIRLADNKVADAIVTGSGALIGGGLPGSLMYVAIPGKTKAGKIVRAVGTGLAATAGAVGGGIGGHKLYKHSAKINKKRGEEKKKAYINSDDRAEFRKHTLPRIANDTTLKDAVNTGLCLTALGATKGLTNTYLENIEMNPAKRAAVGATGGAILATSLYPVIKGREDYLHKKYD